MRNESKQIYISLKEKQKLKKKLKKMKNFVKIKKFLDKDSKPPLFFFFIKLF